LKKKLFISLILGILTFYIVYAEGQSALSTDKESGFDYFFNQNIGKEVTVSIATLDVNITGTLLSAYPDGIIIQTAFNQIYIPRNSIAYVKNKFELKKPEK